MPIFRALYILKAFRRSLNFETDAGERIASVYHALPSKSHSSVVKRRIGIQNNFGNTHNVIRGRESMSHCTLQRIRQRPTGPYIATYFRRSDDPLSKRIASTLASILGQCHSDGLRKVGA